MAKIDLRRINNERFTIRFVHTFAKLGVKTVHSAQKYLKDMDPTTKVGHTKAWRLQKELKEFITQ